MGSIGGGARAAAGPAGSGVLARGRVEQAQCGLEPARRDRRRPRGGLVAGLLEHGRGGLVAHARRALDVMRARRERARAVGERGRGARVRLQPPGLAGAVIDGAPHERMAEAVAPRDVGRPGDVRGQQVVDRRQRLLLAQPGGRRGEVEVERLARHRRAPAEPLRALAQPPDLLPERGCDGGRHPDRIAVLGLMAGRGRGRARELLEVERVAAALRVQARLRRAEQRLRLGLAERTERDLGHHPVAAGLLERGEQAVRHLAGAERERDQDRARRRAAQQVGDQLERGVVRPVDVVEHEQERVAHRHPLEQGTHRAVGVEALVLEPAGRGRRRRRQDAGELGDALADQRLELSLAERGDVVVERVDPDRERQLALELGAAAHEHRVAARGGALGQLAEQPGLADPRLAVDHQPGCAAAAEAVERGLDRRELVAASDESRPLCLHDGRHFRRDPNRRPPL